MQILFGVLIIATPAVFALAMHKSKYQEDDLDCVRKTACPACSREHTDDFPRCPFCKHRYQY